MLKRRSSRMAFFSSSTATKRQPAPSPKPGRTLVLSSTSSSVDLGQIIEEGFNFDFEKSNHFEDLSAAEPLFSDFFLPHIPAEPLAPPPPLPHEKLWATAPSRVPSLRWSLDANTNADSDDDDLLLDELCNTPPEELLLARPITIVYSGRPRLVNFSPSRLSSATHSLRSNSHSRTSSVSVGDSPLSPSSRFSDADDNSSPASSISEYSNIVSDIIPEDSSFQIKLPNDARLKPLKRSHHRNASTAPSTVYMDDLQNYKVPQNVSPKIASDLTPFEFNYDFTAY